MPGQTVQTQIRLQEWRLLYEGDLEHDDTHKKDVAGGADSLHCLPFCLHCLDSLLYGRAT